MQINLAHIRRPSTSGGYVDFAVFGADARTHSNSDRADLLHQLTLKAKYSGLKVDQSALAYSEHGRLKFYGDTNLVNYLSKSGLPRWTHSINV